MAFRFLLKRPVQIANLRVAVDHRLPFQLQHQMNDAVHGRMRRPHVHEHVPRFAPVFTVPTLIKRRIERVLIERLLFIHGIILAQRIPLETVVHQNPPQIRMIRKREAKHIVRLAFEPIGPFPHRHERIDTRIVFRHRRFEPYAGVVSQ